MTFPHRKITSCLENPRDGEAWWAAVYGVAQSQTRLKCTLMTPWPRSSLALPQAGISWGSLDTSFVSDSVPPHRQQPSRLPRPWDSPGFFLEVSHGKTRSRQAQDTATPQPAAATVCELCYPQGYSASANTGHIFLQNVGDLAWELKPTFVSLLCWKGHIKSL